MLNYSCYTWYKFRHCFLYCQQHFLFLTYSSTWPVTLGTCKFPTFGFFKFKFFHFCLAYWQQTRIDNFSQLLIDCWTRFLTSFKENFQIFQNIIIRFLTGVLFPHLTKIYLTLLLLKVVLILYLTCVLAPLPIFRHPIGNGKFSLSLSFSNNFCFFIVIPYINWGSLAFPF